MQPARLAGGQAAPSPPRPLAPRCPFQLTVIAADQAARPAAPGAAATCSAGRRRARVAAAARPAPPPASARLRDVQAAAARGPPRQVAEASLQRGDVFNLEDAADWFQRDEAKEQGRRHMRTLSTFTFERWAFHRSTSRYARHMRGILRSQLVAGLAQPLACCGSVATAVCAYEDMLQRGMLPDFLPSCQLPALPFEFTSFALSLLLVFRTNTSYDRWLQAVTLWGGIANRSSDTLRQLLAYSPSTRSSGHTEAALSAAAMSRWLVTFARSLKEQLTEDSDLQGELQGVLTPQEAGLLAAALHRPSFALAVLSELAAAAPIRDSQRVRVDENLTFFQDCLGSCQCILRTPIPLSYTRHTSRFMVIWLSCLPLGLWRYCGWGTVPLTMVIAFLLLGIEEIGVAIEEPFSILPLEDFCQELELSLSNILEQAAASKQAARQAAAAAIAATATTTGTGGGSAGGAAAAGAGAPGGGAALASAPPSAAAAGAGAAPLSSALPVGNAVAPFLGRGTREGAPPRAASLPPEAIFSSLDESDF